MGRAYAVELARRGPDHQQPPEPDRVGTGHHHQCGDRNAERLAGGPQAHRSAISGLCIIAPGATGGERVHVTVSIGVAALDSGSKREYAELMAAADAALYRAKSGGRDQVQMISTTRGLSAISGGDDPAAAPAS